MNIYLVAAMTTFVFIVGYWSAWVRTARLGLPAPDRFTRRLLAVVAVALALAGYACMMSPGAGQIIAQFFWLCFGQCVGYVFARKDA